MRRIIVEFSTSSAIATMFFAMACAPATPLVTKVIEPQPAADTIAIPLDQLGVHTYRGLQGGLYSGGMNTPPADYQATGVAHANGVRPLSVNGSPSASGKYVLMSVGGATVTAAWCSVSSAPPCDSWTVTGRTVSDPTVNHSSLVIVNGAIPGADAVKWSSAAASNYNRIRDTRLAPLGLSEKQVQAIWMMISDTAELGPIAAALQTRYPKLQLLFISSPPYGGYSATGEPGTYEAGFVLKRFIESRTQIPTGVWISWGPYLWHPGWPRTDFDSTGKGVSISGEKRIAGLVFEFLKTSPFTRCWLVGGAGCG